MEYLMNEILDKLEDLNDRVEQLEMIVTEMIRQESKNENVLDTRTTKTKKRV